MFDSISTTPALFLFMRKKIAQFKEVRVSIPQKFIIRVFYQSRGLTTKEKAILRGKLGEIEQAKNRLQHIESVIDRALL